MGNTVTVNLIGYYRGPATKAGTLAFDTPIPSIYKTRSATISDNYDVFDDLATMVISKFGLKGSDWYGYEWSGSRGRFLGGRLPPAPKVFALSDHTNTTLVFQIQ